MNFELLQLLLPHNYIQLWLAGCLCPALGRWCCYWVKVKSAQPNFTGLAQIGLGSFCSKVHTLVLFHSIVCRFLPLIRKYALLCQRQKIHSCKRFLVFWFVGLLIGSWAPEVFELLWSYTRARVQITIKRIELLSKSFHEKHQIRSQNRQLMDQKTNKPVNQNPRT